ncbi:MAG: DUF134 domain-containing protein [Bacillota bacterium]
MPRPRKCRRVQEPPCRNRFAPSETPTNPKAIILTLDEYEALRLVDHEKKTQAEAATMMEIGRSTVQSTYDRAREKVASALVEGRVLKIEGGDIRFDKTECMHPRKHGKESGKRHGR